MSAPHLALDAAERRYGDRIAVRPTTLALEPGTIAAIAGPSGGGKSTLLRMLTGAVRASTGRVRVDDR
ncbi:MAG: ATP-binding cassette domain-containing protein, partial [Myxococcota bacterium]